MVLMCYDEVEVLFKRFHHPLHGCTCGGDCDTCDDVVYLTCTWLRRASRTKVATEWYLTEASRLWKLFTDTICDTSKCMSCPDYSWCHKLREIYDEGVLCYDSSNP